MLCSIVCKHALTLLLKSNPDDSSNKTPPYTLLAFASYKNCTIFCSGMRCFACSAKPYSAGAYSQFGAGVHCGGSWDCVDHVMLMLNLGFQPLEWPPSPVIWFHWMYCPHVHLHVAHVWISLGEWRANFSPGGRWSRTGVSEPQWRIPCWVPQTRSGNIHEPHARDQALSGGVPEPFFLPQNSVICRWT